jgi:hypothetical protein
MNFPNKDLWFKYALLANVLSFPFDRIAELVHPIEKAQARLRREQPVLGFGLFGFIYILAGFG